MIPERSPYGGKSYKLYDYYNEVHIFVEDAGFENLYEALFKTCGIDAAKIFSKPGKQEVLRAAKTCTDPKCVFVVDRDWDDLLSIMPDLQNVVVLSMHSIECYLVDYRAFSGVVLSEYPKCDIESVLGESCFEKILLKVSLELRPLFECFVALQLSDEKGKGCSHKPGHFQQKNRSCAPDPKKICQFISDSEVSVPQSVKDYFSEEILCEKGHGKFMLHFVWEGVRHQSKAMKIGMEKLMMRLAQLLDSQELRALGDRVKETARKGSDQTRS